MTTLSEFGNQLVRICSINNDTLEKSALPFVKGLTLTCVAPTLAAPFLGETCGIMGGRLVMNLCQETQRGSSWISLAKQKAWNLHENYPYARIVVLVASIALTLFSTTIGFTSGLCLGAFIALTIDTEATLLRQAYQDGNVMASLPAASWQNYFV